MRKEVKCIKKETVVAYKVFDKVNNIVINRISIYSGNVSESKAKRDIIGTLASNAEVFICITDVKTRDTVYAMPIEKFFEHATPVQEEKKEEK